MMLLRVMAVVLFLGTFGGNSRLAWFGRIFLVALAGAVIHDLVAR